MQETTAIEPVPTGISTLLKRKRNQKRYLLAALIVSIVLAGGVLVQKHWRDARQGKSESVSKMYADLAAGQVSKMTVVPSYLFQGYAIELKDGTRYETMGPRLDSSDARAFQANGVEVVFEEPGTDYTALPQYLLIALLLTGLLASMGQSMGISLTRRSVKRSTSRFSDVGGNEEAKEALHEVVQYLRNPARYEKLGARFPKGIIMDGPPGTGKTALGRAVAGEADASFMSISGGDFHSMFMAVSSMKIRAFFAQARRNAPCVIFVDEIDAVGGKRLNEGTSVAREMGTTLNQLLVQMDGFEPNCGVIVVAATNRLELLDPALLRSGRFDRQIHVQLPNLQERQDILRIHGKRLNAQAFDYGLVSRMSIGMSGADLENLLNQAALIAASEGASQVSTEHGLAARDRLLMGDARRTQGLSFDEHTRLVLAAHEAGHAIVGMVCGPDPVTRVSIIPRGRSLGQTLMAPQAERQVYEKHQLLDRIRLLLGGRAAEQLVMQTQTTGAADDLARASELCMELICRYGMHQGLLHITDKTSESLRFAAEKQAQEVLLACLAEATAIIAENRPVFEAIKAELVRDEEIGEGRMQEFTAMLSTGSTAPRTVLQGASGAQ